MEKESTDIQKHCWDSDLFGIIFQRSARLLPCFWGKFFSFFLSTDASSPEQSDDCKQREMFVNDKAFLEGLEKLKVKINQSILYQHIWIEDDSLKWNPDAHSTVAESIRLTDIIRVMKFSKSLCLFWKHSEGEIGATHIEFDKTAENFMFCKGIKSILEEMQKHPENYLYKEMKDITVQSVEFELNKENLHFNAKC